MEWGRQGREVAGNGVFEGSKRCAFRLFFTRWEDSWVDSWEDISSENIPL